MFGARYDRQQRAGSRGWMSSSIETLNDLCVRVFVRVSRCYSEPRQCTDKTSATPCFIAASQWSQLWTTLTFPPLAAACKRAACRFWALPKPPPSLIPARILMPPGGGGNKKGRKTQSHKHGRLGQSWFHNHSVASFLSPSFPPSVSSLLTPCPHLLPSHLSPLSTSCTPICLLFSFAPLFNLLYPPLAFYVLYLHTFSPTL